MKKLFFLIFVALFFLHFSIESDAQSQKFATNGVVAHRGAWKSMNLPQNSLAALKNSFQLGISGSEFDIHLTADNILVINHDPVFQGMIIEKTSYADLSKHPLKNGESIPTFESFLEAGMLQHKTRLFAELKKSEISKERSLLLARKVVEIVSQLKAQAWMVYISFDYDVLKKIIQLEPLALTMYLGGNAEPDQLISDGIGGADYQYSVYKKNTKWVDDFKQHNLKLNVWNINDSLQMDYFMARNFDFYTTNEPEMALKKIEANDTNGNWKLVWADELNYTGLPDSARWSYDTHGNSYGWGNNEAEWYTVSNSNNTWVSDGTLKITARHESTFGKNYSSGRLMTKNKGDWKYCKVEVRAKLPKGNGTWPAIWMMPARNTYGGWPHSGEIDIMEHVGFNPDTVFSTVHTGKYNHMKGTQKGKNILLPTATSEFHVYTLEWEENEIRSYVDGIHYFIFKNEKQGPEVWPYDQPFYLILNLAIGGGLGGRHGIDNSLFPHTFEIDYVRVYQY